jgi:hypothetical protein
MLEKADISTLEKPDISKLVLQADLTESHLSDPPRPLIRPTRRDAEDRTTDVEFAESAGDRPHRRLLAELSNAP